jgi:hypothetical protein
MWSAFERSTSIHLALSRKQLFLGRPSPLLLDPELPGESPSPSEEVFGPAVLQVVNASD